MAGEAKVPGFEENPEELELEIEFQEYDPPFEGPPRFALPDILECVIAAGRCKYIGVGVPHLAAVLECEDSC